MADTLVPLETQPCPDCLDVAVLEVPAEGIELYKSGAHIQVAFPTLSRDDRERLLTGVCPTCWTRMFGEEEE